MFFLNNALLQLTLDIDTVKTYFSLSNVCSHNTLFTHYIWT